MAMGFASQTIRKGELMTPTSIDLK